MYLNWPEQAVLTSLFECKSANSFSCTKKRHHLRQAKAFQYGISSGLSFPLRTNKCSCCRNRLRTFHTRKSKRIYNLYSHYPNLTSVATTQRSTLVQVYTVTLLNKHRCGPTFCKLYIENILKIWDPMAQAGCGVGGGHSTNDALLSWASYRAPLFGGPLKLMVGIDYGKWLWQIMVNQHKPVSNLPVHGSKTEMLWQRIAAISVLPGYELLIAKASFIACYSR